jgi:hypothetical protein
MSGSLARQLPVGPLNAKGNAVLIEQLEIANEGVEQA